MATKEPDVDNRTARRAPTLTDLRHKSLVGVDGRGREHRYCQVRRTVYVLDGDEIAHAEALTERPMREWVAYVESVCGWETLFWSPGSVYDKLAEVFGA
jgi:hypothetical protein